MKTWGHSEKGRLVVTMMAAFSALSAMTWKSSSAATFYGWKQKFGGMDVSESQRLKALEDENRRLKLLVAELSLHGEALKGVIRKNGWSLPV